MSLRECFARFGGPGAWAKNLEVNRILFFPEEISENSTTASYNLVKRMLGVYAGRINYHTIFDKYISQGIWSKAFQILHYTADEEHFSLERRLTENLQVACDKASKKIENFHHRIQGIEGKNILESEKLLLEEIKERVFRISNFRSPQFISHSSIESIETHFSEINEVEDDLLLLESEITPREKRALEDAFELFESILSNIKPFLLEYQRDKKRLIEIFCSLPGLVLSGRTDVLQEMASIENVEQLENVSFHIRQYSPPGTIPLNVQLLPKSRTKSLGDILPISFRPITDFFWKNIPVLDKKFESPKDAREFIESQIRSAETLNEAANLFLGGAQYILSMGEKNILDLQAKGLAELAKHQLLKGKYKYAFDLFADSFCLWVFIRQGLNGMSLEIRETATGMILAHWVPRKISRQQYPDITAISSPIFDNPGLMLEALTKGNDLDILFNCVDQLYESDQILAFLTYLEENSPKIDWASILLERIFQPRLFFQNPSRSVQQLQAILYGKFEETVVDEIVQRLGNVIDITLPDHKPSMSDITELDNLAGKLQFKLPDSPVFQRFTEGITQIIESLKSKVPVAEEIQFFIRPVNTVFFLEEKCSDLEVIMSLKLQETSLSAQFFTVEARIEEKQKGKLAPYISLINHKIEIGAIEPDSNNELLFRINVNSEIFNEYADIPIEFNFFEGLKAIKPIDKKRIFHLSFRSKRQGVKENPYITGPAIEIGGLYVGREEYLKRIKSALIGQSQDNIPLVLGIRRIGKTSLLKRLISDDEIKRRYIPVFLDLEAMPESETTTQFFKRLCEEINNKCGEKWGIPFSRIPFDDDPFGAFDRYIMSFQQATVGTRILIVFDEFEKLIANLRRWQDRYKESDIPPNPCTALVPEIFGALRKVMLHSQRFSFVVAGLPNVKSTFQDYEARWFALMVPIHIEPLGEDEAKALIQPPRIPYKVSSEAVSEIIYMSGYQPYLMQLVCWNLFNRIIESGRETAARMDVERVVEYDILSNEEYFADYRRLMGEDINILNAIALCHKKAGKRRRFVNLTEISEVLARAGNPIPKTLLTSRLKEMEKAERPLVQRSPRRSDAYMIVIGMLSRLLEEEI